MPLQKKSWITWKKPSKILYKTFKKSIMKSVLSTSILLLALALWLPLFSFSQITVEDYEAARATGEYNEKVYRSRISPTWIGDTHHFWYEIQTRKGED